MEFLKNAETSLFWQNARGTHSFKGTHQVFGIFWLETKIVHVTLEHFCGTTPCQVA